jgi:hypothetical protein
MGQKNAPRHFFGEGGSGAYSAKLFKQLTGLGRDLPWAKA